MNTVRPVRGRPPKSIPDDATHCFFSFPHPLTVPATGLRPAAQAPRRVCRHAGLPSRFYFFFKYFNIMTSKTTGLRQALLWLALMAASVATVWADGLTPRQDEKKGKWGFVDNAGNWAIEPKYDSVTTFRSGKFYSFEKVNGKYDYVYVDGEYAIASQKGKFGYLKPDGKWWVKARYLDARPQFIAMTKSGSAAFCMLVREDEGWTIINTRGQKLIDGHFEAVKDSVYTAYSGGRATYVGVRVKGKWGFYCTTADNVPFVYDDVSDPVGGVVRAVRDGRTGFINLNNGGAEMAAEALGNGQKLTLDSNGEFCVVKADGAFLADPRIPFHECHKMGDRFMLKGSGFAALADQNLNAIQVFSAYEMKESGSAVVYLDKKSADGGSERLAGLVDKDGKVVIPCQYADVADFNEKGLAFAEEKTSENGRTMYRFIAFDRNGEEAGRSPLATSYAVVPSDGQLTPVILTNDDTGEKGVMGADCKMVVPMGKYDALTTQQTGGQHVFTVKAGGTTTRYGENGKLGSANYDIRGLVAKKGGKTAFVDQTTGKLMSPWYDAVICFRDPADTQLSDRYGFFKNGPVFIVKSGGKYGIFDVTKRKLVTPCIYDGIGQYLAEQRAVVQKGKLCGAVDVTTGRVIVAPKYIGLSAFTLSLGYAKATVSRYSTHFYNTVYVNTDGSIVKGTQDVEPASSCNLGEYDRTMPDKAEERYQSAMGVL